MKYLFIKYLYLVKETHSSSLNNYRKFCKYADKRPAARFHPLPPGARRYYITTRGNAWFYSYRHFLSLVKVSSRNLITSSALPPE